MPDFSDLWQYYGLDWGGMVCQFIGMFLLARKVKYGFLVFGAGNAAWIAYAFMTGSLAQVIANVVVGAFNLYGFWNWSRQANTTQ